MKKCFAFMTFAICIISTSVAQDTPKQKKVKLYETRIMAGRKQDLAKGVLFEVRDSSVLLGSSPYPDDYLSGNFKVTPINYSNIYSLKIRRTRSVLRGAAIGSATLGTLGFGYATYAASGMGVLTITAALPAGIVAASIGAAGGALLGSIRDRLPVENSFGNFEKYRSSLQDYSFLKEPNVAKSIFEHRFSLAAFAGPSVSFTDSTGMGFNGNLFISYRFSKRFGISFSNPYWSFPVSNSEHDSYWSLGGVLFCPMVTLTLKQELTLDLKPGIGYSSATLISDTDRIAKDGDGLMLSFSAALNYNYSKRWSCFVETGYSSTRQKFPDTDTGTFKALDFDFGFLYKFGRKSL